MKTSADFEAIARQARQTFGDTLPEDFLSKEEYHVYERLYGPPLAITSPDDVEILDEVDPTTLNQDVNRTVLMKEDEEGNLEAVEVEDEEFDEESRERDYDEEAESPDLSFAHGAGEFQSRLSILRGKAMEALERRNVEVEEQFSGEQAAQSVQAITANEDSEHVMEEQDLEEQNEEDEAHEDQRAPTIRGHHLTRSGYFGTSPSTIQLPKDTFVDPISSLLSDASNNQLSEVAEKTFGERGLPNSTATFKRANVKQQTIALEASQGRMGEMEANAFLAAIYPGAYASITSVLVEIRKRLGSEWLRDLMEKEGGPRILDAGGGGVGVLAWRDIIRAECEAMNIFVADGDVAPPYGKSTVVTGSATLRHRASRLLDNTSFIPRLPDYNPSRDHPSLESSNPQPRKQYDIIIAPYTLWPLKEDHMRKSQIQNLWSLLDSHNGGVLVLIEKGVPIGFEMIAGARETLLKHHISSPGLEYIQHSIEDASPNRFGAKEKGMIIAPCTNHGKCPMYVMPGRAPGRKDFCHFNQRFIRPPFLQRILGARDRNHEDVQFSYVAFQRGRDERQVKDFVQGKAAADAAFKGFVKVKPPPPQSSSIDASSDALQQQVKQPHPQSFPRTILPALKRHRHVILDVCTPAATLERWTVPKSFGKHAYRDARKSQWGDLWALGAKTRVPMNVRIGLKGGGSGQGMRDVMDNLMEGGKRDSTGKKGAVTRKKEQDKRKEVARRERRERKKTVINVDADF